MNDMEHGMGRKEYWLWGLGIFGGAFALGFIIGFVDPSCVDEACASFEALFSVYALVAWAAMIYTAYRRTIDIGCSRWWTIAAALWVIGWVILGIIPGEKTDAESRAKNYRIGPSGERVRYRNSEEVGKLSPTEREFEKMQQELDRPKQWP